MTTRRKIIYVFITLLLVVVFLEVALRLVLPALRTATLPGKMIKDHLRGGGLKYDPDLFWYWPQLPIRGLELNEHGFRRNRPMTVDKPPGTVRVVTLGDSQTWGAFMKHKHSYPGVAERELGQGWEVLNGAVPGYRSLNVYRLLQLRIRRFDPDIVVVDSEPFDSPREDGALQQTPLGAGILKQILWHSRIYYVLRHLVAKVRVGVANRVNPNQRFHIFEGEGNHDVIQSWCDAEGIQLLFVDYPTMTPQTRLKCNILPQHLPKRSRIVPVCKALRDSGHHVTKLFQDHNHMTKLGNDIAGRTLAKALRESRKTSP